MEILLATTNVGKIREIKAMLVRPDLEIVGLARFPDVSDVPETGETFLDNARLKAIGYATQTELMTVADDSGLEVAALGGRPGVLSARYGGVEMPYSEKMKLLLGELGDSHDRSARFVCAIAAADAAGRIMFAEEAYCDGTIAHEPRGSGGFGYDPIFVPDGYEGTFAELADSVKQEISHRARAVRLFIRFLQDNNAI